MGETCLTDDEVLALLAGGLRDAADPATEAHLDGCRRCRLMVSTLAAKTGDTFHAGSPSAFGVGETIAGRYQILALIGSGGMGEVYKVLDSVLGETVALKTLSAGTALDERGIARLKSEVQVARRVTHRNVCRVFDVGFHAEDASIPFFTMELLAGETLRSRSRRAGALPVDELRALLAQMASGLDAAHAAGVVHCDLKSENVMLVPEDGGTRVVITDFGLARNHAAEALRRIPIYAREASLTEKTNDFIAGTLGYMAPEQLTGEPTGPATDIYALGVVLYESLTGELPFSVAELAAAGSARSSALPSLRSTSRVSPEWEAVIRRCLETAPAARFQSARELVSALGGQRAPGRARARSTVALAVGIAAVVVGVAAIGARVLRGRSGPPSVRAVVAETAGPTTSPAARDEPSHAAPVATAAPPAPAETPPAPAPEVRKLRRRQGNRALSKAGEAPAIPAAPPPADVVGKDDFIDPFGSRDGALR